MAKQHQNTLETAPPAHNFGNEDELSSFSPPSFDLEAGPDAGFMGPVAPPQPSPLLSQKGSKFESYDFDNDFPWQNPDIRKVLYPTRTNKLKDFLNTLGVDFVKNMDYENPSEETANTIRMQAVAELSDVGEDHAQASSQYDTLDTKVSDLGKEIKSDRGQLGSKRKAEKRKLKEAGLNKLKREVDDLTEQVTKAEKSVKKYKGLGKATQKRFDNGEISEESRDHKLGVYGEKEEKAETELQSLNFQLAKKTLSYNWQAAPILKEREDFEKALEQKQSDKESKSEDRDTAKEKRDELKKQKDRVAAVAKSKEIGTDQVRDWAVYQFRKKVAALGSDNISDHDQVLGAVFELFDQDPSMAIFPGWLRYSTIHFTGMTYESAHGSWYDPQKLLKIIEEHNIKDASPEELEEMMTSAKGDVSAQLDAARERGDAKEIKRLEKQLGQLESGGHDKTAEEEIIKSWHSESRKEAYSGLIKMEEQRYSLMKKARGGSATPTEMKELEELEGKIEAFVKEKKLTASQHSKVRNRIDERATEALAPLIQYSNKKIDKLDEHEVLGLLSSMKGDIQGVGRDEAGNLPEGEADIWKEISAFTQLRNDEAQGDDWTSDFADRRDLYKAQSDNPEVQRWLEILKEWRSGEKHGSDQTNWRAKFRDDLSFVATSLVCNELAEHIQYLQGNKQRGGLNKNSRDYNDAAKGGGSAFFKHPTSDDDFQRGASLFWAEWSSKKPYNANKVDIGRLEGNKFYAPLTHNFKSSHEYKLANQGWYQNKHFGGLKKEEYGKGKMSKEQKAEWADKKKGMIADADEHWKDERAAEHALHKPVPIPEIGGSKEMDGWKYSFENDLLIRTKDGTKQYLRWKHQATVLGLQGNNVLSFNTSGFGESGMGVSKSYQKSALTANHNVYIGYMEGGTESAEMQSAVTGFDRGQYNSGADLFNN